MEVSVPLSGKKSTSRVSCASRDFVMYSSRPVDALMEYYTNDANDTMEQKEVVNEKWTRRSSCTDFSTSFGRSETVT